jgi:hypothetical protein
MIRDVVKERIGVHDDGRPVNPRHYAKHSPSWHRSGGKFRGSETRS